MAGMATEKQVKYCLFLLSKAGYPTDYMSAKFKDFGANMRQRSGTVENWLRNSRSAEISKIIDTLKS